ncbi:MAG: hypothetical protein ACI33S_04080 [Bacilli bacterium]
MKTIISIFSKLLEEKENDQIIKLSTQEIETAKEFLNWLRYEPRQWNIDKLLTKPSKSLTDNEILMLKLRKKELELIPIFESYLNDGNNKYSKLIFDFINLISITSYANIKLLPSEINECNNRLYNMVYSNTDDNIEPIAKLETLIERLNSEEDVMDSYIKFMLKVRLNNIKLAMSVTPSTNKFLSIKKVLKEANNQTNK